MKKFQLVLPFFFLAFIFNYEYFFLNAEGIFIISFLLFSTIFYLFVGDTIGDMLDTSSSELTSKLKEISTLQKSALAEKKKTLNHIVDLQNKFIPLLIYVIFIVEQRELLLNQSQIAAYRNILERKLKEILIDDAVFKTTLTQQVAKEIIDNYENKIK